MSLKEFDVRPCCDEKGVDPFDVGVESLFHLDAVLTLLMMIDGQRLECRFNSDGVSLAIWLNAIAGICLAFSDEALKRLDQIEAARKRAVEESGEVLFDKSDPQTGRG
jgi:hypothetical protein